MKLNVEAILGVLLVVLLCYKPNFLLDLTDTVLGKAVLLLCVLGATHCYGRNAGVLTALIVIVLMHTRLEGVDETLEKDDDKESEKPAKAEKSDDDDDDKSVKSDDEEDKEAKQEAEAASKTTNTIVENEERMRPKDSNEVVASTGKGTETKEGPLPMPSTTTEGFALLN